MANTSMTRLIGVFDDFDSANKAAQELANEGFSREQVHVVSNFRTGAAGSTMMEWDSGFEQQGGGITGFFRRLFGSDVPEEEQGHLAEAVRRGNALLTVDAEQNQIDRAVRIMNDNGAIDIDSRVEHYRQRGYTGYDASAAPYTAEEARRERELFRQGQTQRSIPVVEEEMRVGKRAVQRGGVRVYSHVTEQPVEEDIRLREEHVRVERRPVDRPVSGADASALRDQTIEVTETAEEPVVQKRARVKEEIVIGKETSEHTETIRDTVRRTDVEVEQMGGDVQPAYQYGSRMASDPKFRGKSWSDVEPTLRNEYEREHPNSTWDDIKSSIREGWESVTGRR